MLVAILVLSIISLLAGLSSIVLVLYYAKKQKDKVEVKEENRELELFEQRVNNEICILRETLLTAISGGNKNMSDSLGLFGEAQSRGVANLLKSVSDGMARLEERQQQLTVDTERRINSLKADVIKTLADIRESNSAKLDEMRKTVDEKLQASLEQQLGQSFGLIGDKLAKVHEGLGEMRALSQNVTDLKKVMTGVKTRGIWGEISLGSLLEEILAPEQYDTNVRLGKSNKFVEYAVVMPGQGDGRVLLPIDSKFPLEDYQRLVEASQSGDKALFESASKALEERVKSEAMDIKNKYILPPHTVDFGILYLPIEGLFAEVAKRAGLVEKLRTEYKVMIAGPTTFAALLNSLQLGFKSLAIEKNSREILKLFNKFKKQFEDFTEELAKSQKNAEQLVSHMRAMTDKTQKIETSIGKVLSLDGNNLLDTDNE